MSATRPAAAPGRQSKYRNVKQQVDGHQFDSKAEAMHYLVLRMRQAEGEIRDLEPHPPAYRFELNGVLIGTYRPDFRFVDTATGKTVVVDVKSPSTRTTAYMLKRRLMRAFHGITVTEVMR